MIRRHAQINPSLGREVTVVNAKWGESFGAALVPFQRVGGPELRWVQ